MSIELPVDGATIHADLAEPAGAGGVVVFAHGTGSSRHSPRNRQVAQRLTEEGLATLLVDLLTEEEELLDTRGAQIRFDVGLLAGRVAGATEWLSSRGSLASLPVGYFGASTGAAAALVAAAGDGEGRIRAVVSRGGRPDLAGDALPKVTAPTLLIVGGRDTQVLELNEQAARRLTCAHRVEIVEGATHLFVERGALEMVGDLAAAWFATHLLGSRPG